MEKLLNADMFKSCMTYGAILGIVLVIYSVILFIFNILPVGFLVPSLLFVLNAAIYFTFIFISTKKIKNGLLDGNVTFGQALLIGALIVFCAAIISSIYNYIQNTIIDPDYTSRVLNAQKNWLSSFMSGKVPEDKIEESLAKIDQSMKDYNPLKSLFISIIGSTIWGVIISLITSAILRTKKSPFSN